MLAALGLIARTSPYVASTTARAATRLTSFEEGASALAEQGIKLQPDTVRTITGHVGYAGLADREQATPIDKTFAKKRVVISLDGGCTRLRVNKPGRRRKSGFHGFDAPWREPKIFTAYVIDDKGNQDRKVLPVYEGTFAPWKDAVEIFANTLL